MKKTTKTEVQMAPAESPVILPEPADDLDVPVKASLSIPLVVSMLSRGISQAAIGRACNISKQAVNDYINRYSHEISPLLDEDSGIYAINCKHVAIKGLQRANGILDSSESDISLRDIVYAVDKLTDKYRLLSGRSTSNQEIHTTADLIVSMHDDFLSKAINVTPDPAK